MRILIRVDSSRFIGTGHVARTSALAEELRRRGAVVEFVCRPLSGSILDAIAGAGYTVHRLPAIERENNSWLGGVEPSTDAEETAAIAARIEGGVDWLIVDHYGIGLGWERHLRPLVRRIAVISDLGDREHDCDLLIDTNLQSDAATRYDGLVPEGCRRLQGPAYAMLRPEFAGERANVRQRDGRVRRILIFFGGVDASNETAKALRAIQSLGRSDHQSDVVVGATNPNREAIEEFCRTHAGFMCHVQTGRMAELMAAADLSVGAGGAATWERCALGLPAIVLAVADNQKPACEAMASQGRTLYLGDCGEVSEAALARVLAGVMETPQWLRLLGERSAELVDGQGLSRLGAAFFAPRLILRPTGPGDCSILYNWRNAPEVIAASHSPEPISWEAHETWFARSLENPSRLIFIAEADGQPAGALRYDVDKDEALVSIYLAPGRHGRGLGTAILLAGSDWLKKNRTAVKHIRAEILAGNVSSQKAFLKAGYREEFATYKKIL